MGTKIDSLLELMRRVRNTSYALELNLLELGIDEPEPDYGLITKYNLRGTSKQFQIAQLINMELINANKFGDDNIRIEFSEHDLSYFKEMERILKRSFDVRIVMHHNTSEFYFLEIKW